MVVGGGSAGHVLPALPVIEALLAAGHPVTFVGTRSGLERSLLSDTPCDFRAISAGKLRRYFSMQNLFDVLRIALGIGQALWLMIRLRPNVIFSKGGFVSFPVVVAGWLCRIPVVAHESDITPGLANRLVTPMARTICTSFAHTRFPRARRVVHTGSPLRRAITQGDAGKGRMRLGLAAKQPLLVVTGGSLGADGLNQIIRDSLPWLTPHFHVFHVCGSGKLAERRVPGYEQVEYVGAGWGDILAAADIIVSRAGANALFEIVALGKRNLLVPLPKVASRGDQLENAAYAETQGWSLVIQEDNLTPAALRAGLDRLVDEAEQWSKNLAQFTSPDATEAIVREILALA